MAITKHKFSIINKIKYKAMNYNKPQSRQFLLGAVIGSILRWGFRMINWNHFRIKAHNGKPRIKRIIKLKGFRTALIEEYDGNRCTSRFYWRVGKYYL